MSETQELQALRLANAAKSLGEYILEAEWDLLYVEVARAPFTFTSLEQFVGFAKGFMYYEALVCACGGHQGDIDSQLEVDYDELREALPESFG